MARIIFIGDVHGCRLELDALLHQLDPGPKDRVIFIGDLVNKGPDSMGVMRRFHETKRVCRTEAVLGNHELRLLDDKRQRRESATTQRMRAEFGPRFKKMLRDIGKFPAFIEKQDWVAVHAGLVPGRAPSDTSAAALCNIRTWDGAGEDLQDRSNPAWFDVHEGGRPVVFGHWAELRGVLDRDHVIGLDTGCVYGGKLTACVFKGRDPEAREIVSVPALKPYCPVD